jgi:hypothetical protein
VSAKHSTIVEIITAGHACAVSSSVEGDRLDGSAAPQVASIDALRIDQVADDADHAEHAAHRHGHIAPEHRDRFQAGHGLHAAAQRIVPAPPDDDRDQRQGGQADQPVQHAPDARRAPAVKHVHADHGALPEGHGDSHEHHPDQAEADQDFAPLGGLLKHEARDDLEHAERRRDDQHQAGHQHGEAGGPPFKLEEGLFHGIPAMDKRAIWKTPASAVLRAFGYKKSSNRVKARRVPYL